jgi:hypothetical protein
LSGTLTLRRPVGNLHELTLRRPTAAELRPLPMRVLRANASDAADGRASSATWGDLLAMVAGCSGLTLEALDGLAPPDAVSAIGIVSATMSVPEGARDQRVRVRGDGATEIDLAHPLTLGSETLSKLTLLACTARHLRDMRVDPGIGDLLDLGGRLSLQPAAIIDRLDVEDALLLIEVAAGFFSDSRGTGAAS